MPARLTLNDPIASSSEYTITMWFSAEAGAPIENYVYKFDY